MHAVLIQTDLKQTWSREIANYPRLLQFTTPSVRRPRRALN